ncbi:PAS domain S-box protein [Sulfurirhabdus autotrophica]|nr:PAS domain S-box protein [Sulfurirhabdus autotrophica]
MASSAETTSIIEQALKNHYSKVVIHRVDKKQDLHQALEDQSWQLVFSDLELTDFSAIELISLLGEKKINTPVILIKDTGAEEIAVHCLEAGMNQFIQCTAPYLQQLPLLIEAFIRRAEENAARYLLEKKLRESEERYLDIFENTSDLIQCVATDGSFIYTNTTWRHTMGYTEEEVQSLNLLDVLHPESVICCQDRFARLLNGESLCCIEFKFLTKSGEAIHLAGDCGAIVKNGVTISTRGIFKNITEKVKAEDALKESELRYQSLYENAPDIYTTINTAGEILSINRIGASMLGYAVSELIGKSAVMVIHPEDQRTVIEYMGNQFSSPDAESSIEYRKIRKDGSVLWVHQRVSLESNSEPPRLFVVCRDVTEKHQLEKQLAHQAAHDALTNLINRREFEFRLQRIVCSASYDTDQHVLCFLDLDQFKKINDSCGHMAGDELLRQIAGLLDGQMRSRDTLARLGGDEFAILMEHCPLDKAISLAETIRESIEQFEFYWRTHRFTLGVSIGVFPMKGGFAVADIMNMADLACYTAKKKGRNRVHLYHPDDMVLDNQ